ncbi:MAG: AAA family ATPase [Tissierellia bacterium]|nr:AAA family ATPase [Tissierellia bacterium]
MYIKNVHIKNFRNFKEYNVSLKPFSIIIGENDSGKSNFIDALCLPLSKNDFRYNSKSLKISDINKEAILEFIIYISENLDIIKDKLTKGEDLSEIFSKIPIVEVVIEIVEAKSSIERAILKDWMVEREESISYEIKYTYQPRKSIEIIEYMIEIVARSDNIKESTFPVELYEYNITSTNNERRIPSSKLANLKVSIIHAERDSFSDSEYQKSNKMISELIEKNLDEADKVKIHKAYINFFEDIKEVESFKNAFDHLNEEEFKNIKKYMDDMNLTPNFPNLKNVFSNINIGYGDDFLYQRGLGTRNFVLMAFLFSYYYKPRDVFNLICIEEPEAHLCVNNFNIVLDFINKSRNKSNTLAQILLTSHNPKIINKLRLDNVIVLTEKGQVDFSNVDEEYVKYLAKRPNFDILKLLFSNKVILVEGPTEEMLINSILELREDNLVDIEVIAVGHKGFRKYLDIWLLLNKGNENRKIGIIRDFDNQPKAKEDHDIYDVENANVFVRTTKGYTLEDDLASSGNNSEVLSDYFEIENDKEKVSEFLKSQKAENMLNLAILIADKELSLEIPTHINEVIECLLD